MNVRIGLVGYGTGGRYFHAPYIAASPHCELVGVVARSQEKKVEVAEDFPDVRSVDSLAELVELGVDAVVISTPPHTRRELVLEAIEAGVAVVADKPFAPNAKAGQELVDSAAKAGVLLNVFHNRRYDTDFVTAMKVRGQLGQLRGLDLRFDLDEPESLELGHEGGLLRDLGSHVVDQALTLLGSAYEVTAHLCFIESEKVVLISASASLLSMARVRCPRFPPARWTGWYRVRFVWSGRKVPMFLTTAMCRQRPLRRDSVQPESETPGVMNPMIAGASCAPQTV